MNYEPRVIEKFASWHIAVISFVCMGMGLIAGNILGAYASRYGFRYVHADADIYTYENFKVTLSGAYAMGGYVAGLFVGFWGGKFVGFVLSYPLRVNAQLLLLAIRVEEQLGPKNGMGKAGLTGSKPPRLTGIAGGYQDAA